MCLFLLLFFFQCSLAATEISSVLQHCPLYMYVLSHDEFVYLAKMLVATEFPVMSDFYMVVCVSNRTSASEC